MRPLGFVLFALLVAAQYPLWLGKGGWVRVWDAERQLQVQRNQTEARQARNDALAADVRDLKQGLDAIEERARFDLGMVRQDEVFVQIVDRPDLPSTAKQAVLPR
jgi:cell division protein FtsB